jgi:heme exporter protein A
MSAALAAATVGATAACEARDLAHRYGARSALEPLSFSLAAPTAAAVTGPNGSGKTTLLRIISGLLRAGRGTCTLAIGGREVPPGERRRWVGYAGPALAFYDELTVAENLTFAAETRGLPDPGAATAAALERVGLAVRAADRVAALSSGMLQRLRLAFALLHRPPVLLLDEPGSHLDEEGRALVARVVEEERRRCLVLIATNDEREWRLAEQRIELRGRGLGHPA